MKPGPNGESDVDKPTDGGTGSVDEIIIGLPDGIDDHADAATRHVPPGSEIIDTNETLGFAVARLPKESNTPAQIARIDDRDDVRYAEANGTMTADGPPFPAESLELATAVTPDDTYYDGQNAPTQVNAPAAWDTTLGSSDVTIAVLDTGTKYDHEDLAANMDDSTYSAPDGADQSYDPSNHGWDFINKDNDPYPDSFDSPVESHGTSVSGIAGAVTDNGTGVAGISNCSLLSVRVLNEDGSGTLSLIANGIEWAASNGADIINMSLGKDLSSDFPSETIGDALTYAKNNGALCIAAAGNNDEETSTYSPAGQDPCMAVSALNTNEERASTNQWGSNWGDYVDLAAPGTHHDVDSDQQSTYPADPENGGKADEYWKFNGTSMAAPVVAGVAGLVLSVDDSLSIDQLESTLKDTAKDVGLDPKKQGAGQVDAGAAVDSVATLSLDVLGDSIPQDGDASIPISTTAADTVVVEDLWLDWSDAGTLSWDADADSVDDRSDTEGTITFSWNSTQSADFTLTISPPSRYVGGEYLLSVSASDSTETVETTASLTIEN